MKPHWSRTMLKGAVTGALCVAVLGSAAAQDSAIMKDSAITKDSAVSKYPARPVRLVVPYAAGGGTDALARFLAQGLERQFGQPFIIENRPGQGTATGAAYVARSAPDGYTLLAATSSTLAFNPSVYKKLPYDPLVDFSPISLVAAVPFVLVVNPSLPANSVSELVALAKAKPGELSYASGGMGAPHHIYMELFKRMTGTDIRHIPYRGGGPALGDVVAGHVPFPPLPPSRHGHSGCIGHRSPSKDSCSRTCCSAGGRTARSSAPRRSWSSSAASPRRRFRSATASRGERRRASRGGRRSARRI